MPERRRPATGARPESQPNLTQNDRQLLSMNKKDYLLSLIIQSQSIIFWTRCYFFKAVRLMWTFEKAENVTHFIPPVI
jgi:hypothetical protein